MRRIRSRFYASGRLSRFGVLARIPVFLKTGCIGHLELGRRVVAAVAIPHIFKMRSGVINMPNRISLNDDAFDTLRNVPWTIEITADSRRD